MAKVLLSRLAKRGEVTSPKRGQYEAAPADPAPALAPSPVRSARRRTA